MTLVISDCADDANDLSPERLLPLRRSSCAGAAPSIRLPTRTRTIVRTSVMKNRKRKKSGIKAAAKKSPKASLSLGDECSIAGQPIWQLNHDFHIGHLTEENFHKAEELIDACEKVGVARLKRGERTEEAGFYLAELAAQLAVSIEALIREGDVQLARRLPSVVERLCAAQERYGMTVTARLTRRNTISALLEKHAAKELLAMVFAKQPELDKVMHRLPWKDIKAMPEEKLRALLLTTVADARGGKSAPHPLVAHIVRFFDLGDRKFERPNINLFVENLWRGFLWSGPGKTFEKCPWFGDAKKPVRENTRAWMTLIRDFLREHTQNDMSKLAVFRTMLARRRRKFAKSPNGTERLRSDDPTYVVGEVLEEIEEAWKTLANKASGRKRKAKAAQ